MAHPYHTVDEAVAAAKDGGTIAITDGKYAVALDVRRPVTLVGRCTSKVSLYRKDADGPVITASADLTVRGLYVTGGAAGILVTKGKTRLVEARVEGTGANGIHVVGSRAELDMEHSLIAGTKVAGISVEGATARVRNSEIRKVQLSADDFGSGVSLLAQGKTMADLTLTGVVVTESAGAGVVVHGSKARIEGTLIRGSGAMTSGTGVFLDAFAGMGSEVDLIESVVDGTTNLGVGVFDGTLRMDRTTISDTKFAERAAGLVVSIDSRTKRPGTATITRSLIRGSPDNGVFVYGGTVDMSSTLVRDTTGGTAALSGRGLVVGLSTPIVPNRVTLTDVLVERALGAGVTILTGDVTLDRVVVRDIAPSPRERKYGFGTIAYVSSSGAPAPTVTMRRSVIERVHDAGVVSFGATLTMEQSVVRRVAMRWDGTYGHGIHVSAYPGTTVRSQAVIKGCVFADVFEAGLNVFQSDAEVEGTTILGVMADEAGHFGDGITVSGKTFTGDFIDTSLVVRNTRISQCARAGLSVFGAKATASGLRLSCNAFGLDVESLGKDPEVTDLRGNACGCGVLLPCIATTANLTPISAP